MKKKINIFPLSLITLVFTSCDVFAANRPSAMNHLSALGPDLLNQVTATARGLNTKQTAVDVEVKYIKQETKKISIGSTIGLEPTVRKDNAVIAAFAEWEQACKNLAKQPYEKTEVIRDTHIVTKETYSCKLTCTGNYTLDDTGKTCIEKSNNGQTTVTECPHGTEKDTTTNTCVTRRQNTTPDTTNCTIGEFIYYLDLTGQNKTDHDANFESWKASCKSLKQCAHAIEMTEYFPFLPDTNATSYTYRCGPKECESTHPFLMSNSNVCEECPAGTTKDTTSNTCKYIKQEPDLQLEYCYLKRFRMVEVSEEYTVLSDADKESQYQDFEAWETACQSLKECSNAEEMYARPAGGNSDDGGFYECSPKKCLEGYERTDSFKCVEKATATTPGNTTTTGTNEASKFNTDFQTATDAFNARVKEILTTCANENGYISEDGTKCEQRQN